MLANNGNTRNLGTCKQKPRSNLRNAKNENPEGGKAELLRVRQKSNAINQLRPVKLGGNTSP